MVLNSLLCADVPLRTYTLTHAPFLLCCAQDFQVNFNCFDFWNESAAE